MILSNLPPNSVRLGRCAQPPLFLWLEGHEFDQGCEQLKTIQGRAADKLVEEARVWQDVVEHFFAWEGMTLAALSPSTDSCIDREILLGDSYFILSIPG